MWWCGGGGAGGVRGGRRGGRAISVSRARLAESSVVAEELAVVGVVGELGVVLERAEDGHHQLVAQQNLVDGGVVE